MVFMSQFYTALPFGSGSAPSTPAAIFSSRTCVEKNPWSSICFSECQRRYVLDEEVSERSRMGWIEVSYLTKVKIMPGHKNTTLAIARPFLL